MNLQIKPEDILDAYDRKAATLIAALLRDSALLEAQIIALQKGRSETLED